MGLTFSRVWERMVRTEGVCVHATEEEQAKDQGWRPHDPLLGHATFYVAAVPALRQRSFCSGKAADFAFGTLLTLLVSFLLFTVWREGDAHLDGRSRCCR